MPFFTKIRFAQNYILHYNLSQNEARGMKFVESLQKNMTSSMLDFLVILQFYATGSVIKCVETLDFHIEYVF